MSLSKSRGLKLMGLASALMATLSFSPFFMGRASADYVLCRTDPVVALSNGVFVDLTASISDSATDVSNITYAVHVPKGVKPLGIYTTPGPLARVETVKIIDDNRAGTYDTTTTVTTGTAGAPVTVTMLLASQGAGFRLGSDSASGVSPQPLSVHVTAAN